ncbi:MAG: hypothetical protein CMJ59_13465 [Planctomycetaceae bacterium]|nr:hypothetical protein [Planctomycetaceae bacterium]
MRLVAPKINKSKLTRRRHTIGMRYEILRDWPVAARRHPAPRSNGSQRGDRLVFYQTGIG